MNNPVSHPHLNCPSCGAANPAESRFCGRCGTSLAAKPVQPAQAQRPTATKRKSQPPPARNRSGLWLAAIAGLSLVLLAICGVTGWLVYRNFLTPPGEVAAQPVMTQAEATATPQPLSLPTADSVDSPALTPAATPVIQGETEAAPASTPVSQDAEGGYILFAAADSEAERTVNIYLSDTGGNNRKLLGSSTLDEREGATPGSFSPNGQWLYFLTRNSDGTDFYVANADGSNLRNILSSHHAIHPPRFVHDGWNILVELSVCQGGNSFNCYYIYNFRTDRLTNIKDYPGAYFSYDGKWALLLRRVIKNDVQNSIALRKFHCYYALLDPETGHHKTLRQFENSSCNHWVTLDEQQFPL